MINYKEFYYIYKYLNSVFIVKNSIIMMIKPFERDCHVLLFTTNPPEKVVITCITNQFHTKASYMTSIILNINNWTARLHFNQFILLTKKFKHSLLISQWVEYLQHGKIWVFFCFIKNSYFSSDSSNSYQYLWTTWGC